MSKQMSKHLLGVVTLKSGNKFDVDLGTTVTYNANSFKDFSILTFTGRNGSTFTVPGDRVEFIETYTAEVEIEVPDLTAE